MPRAARKSQPDYLLVDISNSFTKLAFATRDRIRRSSRIPTGRLTSATLRRLLAKRRASAWIVSSVVPRKNTVVKKAAGPVPTLFIDSSTDLGVGIDYPNPSTIGADRLANAAAAVALYGYPSIVVDFGTAVTFDVVSKDCCYIGGVIAPGLESMTTFLYQRTA